MHSRLNHVEYVERTGEFCHQIFHERDHASRHICKMVLLYRLDTVVYWTCRFHLTGKLSLHLYLIFL